MRSNNAAQHERILRYFARHVEEVRAAGLAGVVVEDHALEGARLVVGDKEYVNFGNCSYSGLSNDPRLKAGAIDLVERYGTSFSSSVAYASIKPLQDLQQRIGQMYGGAALVLSTTTLAHAATLPVIVSPGAAVLVDSQAHASLHMASKLLTATGIEVQVLPHNDVVALEAAVDAASRTHDRVWYLADGVYSMFGDVAPMAKLRELLDTYENLWLYMDDAHGIGWAGPNGTGVVTERMGRHDRMVISASLSKSFGSGGGLVVFPNDDLARRVVLSAGAYNFGGPLHTAAVGAGLVAAEILLSSEIVSIRRRLDQQIDLVIDRGRALGVPFASWDRTPIWFVRVGGHDDMVEVGKRLRGDGFHINPASFPIVPKDESGIRFTHTLDNTEGELDALLSAVGRHVRDVVGEVIVRLDEPATTAGAIHKGFS